MAEHDAVAVVEHFFRSLDTGSIQECADRLSELVSDDFTWVNSGLPTCEGREAAVQFLLGMGQQMPAVGLKVDMIVAAAQGNRVATERVDHFVDKDGNALISLPLAGTLEVDEAGRISAWRDYFDPRPLLG